MAKEQHRSNNTSNESNRSPVYASTHVAKCCAGVAHFSSAMQYEGKPMACYGVPYTRIKHESASVQNRVDTPQAAKNSQSTLPSAGAYTWVCTGVSEQDVDAVGDADNLPQCTGFELFAAPEDELHTKSQQQQSASAHSLSGDAIVKSSKASDERYSNTRSNSDSDGFTAAFRRSARRITDRMGRHLSFIQRMFVDEHDGSSSDDT